MFNRFTPLNFPRYISRLRQVSLVIPVTEVNTFFFSQTARPAADASGVKFPELAIELAIVSSYSIEE